MAPEIAILVSTFQRPDHLRRVLASIACQRGIRGAIEVVVSDDGSRDDTPEIVSEFAARAPFRVAFTTHVHTGFHLTRCRNAGVAASSAPYLLFLDGDCLIPPDHVATHLARRRNQTAMAGYCLRLDRACSETVDLRSIESTTYTKLVSSTELRRYRLLALRSRWYELIRHPEKPKLFGGNVGIWRSDYARVNGYDERFRGWGCEDDDLRMRLRASGISVRTIAGATCTYHLWHPLSPSVPDQWREGANVAYLLRKNRTARCELGLDQHHAPASDREPAYA